MSLFSKPSIETVSIIAETVINTKILFLLGECFMSKKSRKYKESILFIAQEGINMYTWSDYIQYMVNAMDESKPLEP